MGILNVTPDSFSDGGQLSSLEATVAQAQALVRDGADILDIGGESTRPGAEGVDVEEELRRVLPVFEALARQDLGVPLSVDTSKAAVAEAALARGAAMVNDVSALGDPRMAATVAAHGASLVLMHMRGEPRTMQRGELHYDDLIGEIRDHLRRALDMARSAGVSPDRLLVDPGIGFGKTTDHNLTLTRRLGDFRTLGVPIVFGPSRKRFLGELTGREVFDRDRATAAVCALAVAAGADMVRVHDVGAVKDAVTLAAAIRAQGQTAGAPDRGDLSRPGGAS